MSTVDVPPSRAVTKEIDMPTLRESILRKLIENGETSTIELKVAIPRPGEMAEKLCGLANAQGGRIYHHRY